MSELRSRLSDYVALRRALGFVLKEGDWLLPSFVDYLEDRDASYVSVELAVAWATSSPDVLAVTRRQRLTAVRRFAEYLNTVDPGHEVPAADLLPASYTRVTPYLYSEGDIDGLIASPSWMPSPSGPAHPTRRAATPTSPRPPRLHTIPVKSQPHDRRIRQEPCRPVATMHASGHELPAHRTDKKPANTDTKSASLQWGTQRAGIVTAVSLKRRGCEKEPVRQMGSRVAV
jgi:hypothetical protein